MGYLRLFLAALVVADHLTPINWVGKWAVVVFYALSGYGITAAFQGKYKGQFKRFWVTRFWRLYPLYLICWLLSAVWTYQVGSFKGMGWGEPWSILMISWQQPTPIPPAWIFTNILIGYLAISLGLSRRPRIAFAWLALSIAAYMTGDISIADREDYRSVFFASLPFALGASAYWQGIVLPRTKGWDALCEALSYPVFLSHYLIGAIASAYLGLPIGWPLFLVSLPMAFAFSWALIHCEKWMKRHAKLSP